MKKAVKSILSIFMAFILSAGSAQNFNSSAVAVTPPAVPDSFTAARASGTSIKLSWKAAGGATGYVLYRYSSTTKTYNRLKVTAALSYTNTGLVTNTTYSYKVRAFRTVNGTNYYGNPSAAASATTTADELLGVAPARMAFTLKMLNLYANTDGTINVVNKYITRKQIIEYGKTGKGLTVVNHEDGTPAIALINCNSDYVTSFNRAIESMKTADSNYINILTGNGVVAFMTYKFDKKDASEYFTYKKEGIIIQNINKVKSVGGDHSGDLMHSVVVESFGIKMENLGGDYWKYEGFLKQLLASDCWWNLYKKTGSSYCQMQSRSGYMYALTFYNKLYAPVTFKDKKIQDLLKNVRTKGLALPFGGTWSEIAASIKDRPDWTS
jgi:hypothetical protein